MVSYSVVWQMTANFSTVIQKKFSITVTKTIKSCNKKRVEYHSLDFELGTCWFVCESTSTRRQRRDLFGLKVNCRLSLPV